MNPTTQTTSQNTSSFEKKSATWREESPPPPANTHIIADKRQPCKSFDRPSRLCCVWPANWPSPLSATQSRYRGRCRGCIVPLMPATQCRSVRWAFYDWPITVTMWGLSRETDWVFCDVLAEETNWRQLRSRSPLVFIHLSGLVVGLVTARQGCVLFEWMVSYSYECSGEQICSFVLLLHLGVNEIIISI